MGSILCPSASTIVTTDFDPPFSRVGIYDYQSDTTVSHKRGPLVWTNLIMEEVSLLAIMVPQPNGCVRVAPYFEGYLCTSFELEGTEPCRLLSISLRR